MKTVRTLSEVLLSYRRNAMIYIIDITEPTKCITSLFLDDDYHSFDEVMKPLWDYLEFHVVGEMVSTNDDIYRIIVYISNIVP